MEPHITDWITSSASIIAALGVVFVAMQAYITRESLRKTTENIELTRKLLTADHERSRRERALDILGSWTRSLTVSQPSARNLVEKFTPEECQNLLKHKPFTISIDNEKTLEAALDNYVECQQPKIEGDKIFLDERHLFKLGYQCMTFLNSLEIAVQGWLHSVGDEDILEQELSYLVKPEKNYHVLKNFRAALGGPAAYPAIQAFVDHIEKQKSRPPERKGKVA